MACASLHTLETRTPLEPNPPGAASAVASRAAVHHAGTSVPAHYVSADSAPHSYAVRRAPALAPVLLAVFGALTWLITASQPMLSTAYRDLLSFFGVSAAVPADLSFRPYLLVCLVLLAFGSPGALGPRLRLGLWNAVVYLGLVLCSDAALTLSGIASPFGIAGDVLSGVIGIAALTGSIFLGHELPRDTVVARRCLSRGRDWLLVPAAAVAAVGAVTLTTALASVMPPLPLFGGFVSVAVIFLLMLVTVLVIANELQRRHRPAGQQTLSVAFLVPAHNEQHAIAATIQAIDEAARSYGGQSRLVIVDNASRDMTIDAAQAALARCRWISGNVLTCHTPGKSAALNHGLRAITEDIVVRIDADTLVQPELLGQLLPWFEDPRVGGVTGMAWPTRRDSWIARIRIMEVVYNVGFLRLAQAAVDAVMVMPGILAAYRRVVVSDLGGFGEGFNGEDADMTVRIGRAGFRIIVEPAIRIKTEVPATYAQLREQRLRWTRGLYHMASRNTSMIRRGQGLRGVLVLPWTLLNASRMALMVPMSIVFVITALAGQPILEVRQTVVFGSLVVVLQLVVLGLLLVRYGEAKLVPLVPTYLAFRLYRAYVSTETLLTLRIRAASP
jgi:cellulose synthase/poly-beta-1,6-N-acetylglucosamine synthase-like glycosyltransferase